MTLEEIHKLPRNKLVEYFHSLTHKNEKLNGEYVGHAWSFSHPVIASIANTVWSGKKFLDRSVRNRVAGQLVIVGDVYYGDSIVIIYYPSLKLEDELRYTGKFWLGRMTFKGGYIWFTLSKKQVNQEKTDFQS